MGQGIIEEIRCYTGCRFCVIFCWADGMKKMSFFYQKVKFEGHVSRCLVNTFKKRFVTGWKRNILHGTQLSKGDVLDEDILLFKTTSFEHENDPGCQILKDKEITIMSQKMYSIMPTKVIKMKISPMMSDTFCKQVI